MTKIHAYTQLEPYIYCPRCGTTNILFLASTRRGEQFMCGQCRLEFWLVEAAVWQEVPNANQMA